MTNVNDNNGAVEKLVTQSLNSDVPPEVEARLRGRLAAFRERMDAAEVDERPAPARTIVQTWRRTLAYAAPVAAALLVGIVFWMTAGGNGAKAYAQVVEQLRQARTLTYEIFMPATGPTPDIRMKVEYKEMGESVAMRLIFGDGEAVSIIDLDRKKGLSYIVSQRKYLEIDLSDAPDDKVQANFIDELQSLPERATRAYAMRENDGREMDGYVVTELGLEKTVWIDAKTGDLVRIDGKFVNAPEMEVVISNFQFDVELDDALFSLEPPEGYTPLADPVSVGEDSVEDLVQFLRWFAEHHREKLFPPTMDPVEVSAEITRMAKEGELVGLGQDKADANEAFRMSLAISQGLVFILLMQPDSDWHYAGKGITLGDTETAIFWWKPDGATDYRVIYGDLTIRDLAPEDLPATATQVRTQE